MSVTDDSTAVPPNGEGNGRNASSPEESARSSSDSSQQQQQVAASSSTGVDTETSTTENETLDTAIQDSDNAANPTNSDKEEVDPKTDDVFDALFSSPGELITTKKLFETLPKQHQPAVTELILETLEKTEKIRKKVNGIANLEREDFLPKKLLQLPERLKLDINDEIAYTTDMKALEKNYEDNIKNFQTEMKDIILKASKAECKHMKDQYIINFFTQLEDIADSSCIEHRMRIQREKSI